MKQEQVDKLTALNDRLLDMFFEECDIDQWPTTETKEGRGDRYWMKKNATTTLALIGRIHGIMALNSALLLNEAEDEKEDAGLDKQIKAAERVAKSMLTRYAKQRIQ